MEKYDAHALDNMFSYIIIRNSTFLVIVLNSYPILELIGTDMKHKIINLKKSGILIMAVFAMVTTLCARPLMAFAMVMTRTGRRDRR